MNKFKIMAIIMLMIFTIPTVALAWSTGDRVHVVFGSGSSAHVKSGYIRIAGSSNSKVEWDNCYNCQEWVPNSAFYYSRSSAQERCDEMDSEHLSLGEAAGAAAAVGLLYMLLNN